MSEALTPSTTHAQAAGEILIDDIDWGSRIRTLTDDVRKHIEDLSISIALNGLIQPPLLNFTASGKVEGKAGWCRTQAFKLLGHTHIPYCRRDSLTEIEALQIELDENFKRLEMTWKDSVRGLAKFHEIHKTNASHRGEKWGLRASGSLLGVSVGWLNTATILARELDRGTPEVHKAESATDAIKALTRLKEIQVNEQLRNLNSGVAAIGKIIPQPSTTRPLTSGLISDQLRIQPISLLPSGSVNEREKANAGVENAADVTTTVELSKMLLNMDCHEWFREREPESVDVIVTDIPYGIDMENLDEIDGIDVVAHAHEVEENVEQFEDFLRGSFKVLKDKSYLAFFYDIGHHEKLTGFGRAIGFNVMPFPLLWLKPNAKNRAAHCHWPKCFESVMIMRKGAASLRLPQKVNYFMADNRAEKKLQANPFAKPTAFLQWMMEPIVVPGMTLLDPYMGGGSVIRTALNMGLRPIGIEKDVKQFPGTVESIRRTILSMTTGKVLFT